MSESPTKLLDEFIAVFNIQIRTRDSWEAHEVIALVAASQAHALNRFIARLEHTKEKVEFVPCTCGRCSYCKERNVKSMRGDLISQRERSAGILAKMIDREHCPEHPDYNGIAKPEGPFSSSSPTVESNTYCIGCWEVYIRSLYLLIDKKAQQARLEDEIAQLDKEGG